MGTIDLWRALAENGSNNIIILENFEHRVIGSIQLNKWFNYSNSPVISETNNKDKYYLYVEDLGLGMYFTYFKVLRKI